MRYAVIGKGFIYERHKQAIEATGGIIEITCDIDQSKDPDFTDWVEMFHHPDFLERIDAVVICTPNYLHSVIAREAKRLGKRVICEKPLSIDGTQGLEGVNTVLQLRYHPELKKVFEPKTIYVEAKMYRDDSYWTGWKGNKHKSGGILYNLGIHYIDLLIYLLGDVVKINKKAVGTTMASGEVEFRNGVGSFSIGIVNDRKDQKRRILIDGKEINLSDKDNLSYEDLHKEVYWDFLRHGGVSVLEASKSLDLVKELCR